MSVVDDLKKRIDAGRITFDKRSIMAELLGENAGSIKVPESLQRLVLALNDQSPLRLSSIIRADSMTHHQNGFAFDVGNEEIAENLLGVFSTDAKVKEFDIDEIIFDATVTNAQYSRNKWNYDRGQKHNYGTGTLDGHRDHIHFAVRGDVSRRLRFPSLKLLTPRSHGAKRGEKPPLDSLRMAAAPSLSVIDFRVYPDNFAFPASFFMGTTGFEAIDPNGKLFINVVGPERGLQFDSSGVAMTLRKPVDSLLMTVGGFAGEVTVTAYDVHGGQVYASPVQPANQFIRCIVTAPSIKHVEVTGGGGEGLLVEAIIPE